MKTRSEAPRWLLLIHQIPPRPAYLRVKTGRQLAKAGAVAIKNSVYALPASEAGTEAFAWVRKEIVDAGGEASVVEGGFVDGLTNAEVERLFQSARDSEYGSLAADAKKARDAGAVERVQRHLAEIEAIDFFAAPRKAEALREIERAKARLRPGSPSAEPAPPRRLQRRDYRGRSWVTREHVGVDRMASAWLIRRAIDPDARFRFVPRDAAPRASEVRFDMFDGAFTHEGNLCTFEVLLDRFAIDETGFREVGEIVHALDLDDRKTARPDTAGIGRVIAAIAAAHSGDDARLERAFALFDDLRVLFSRPREKR